MPRRPSVSLSEPVEAAGGVQRLDKWLWFARVVKTRTLAAGLVQDRKVRVNRERTDKPSHSVRPGDVITLTVHRQVRVLKVLAPGVRRGPAKEAIALYEDLTPPAVTSPIAGDGFNVPHSVAEAGRGRPTKKDRRAIDRFKGQQDQQD